MSANRARRFKWNYNDYWLNIRRNQSESVMWYQTTWLAKIWIASQRMLGSRRTNRNSYYNFDWRVWEGPSRVNNLYFIIRDIKHYYIGLGLVVIAIHPKLRIHSKTTKWILHSFKIQRCLYHIIRHSRQIGLSFRVLSSCTFLCPSASV